MNLKFTFDSLITPDWPKKLKRFRIRLLNSLFILWSDKRLRTGMIVLLILAPCSKYLFLLFPENGVGDYLINIGPIQIINTIETPNLVEGIEFWYFITFKEYFWSVGELMAPTIAIFGIFLLFPRKYYPAYFMAVPFGYFLSNLMHRMFFVSSFETFHSGVALSYGIMLGLLGIGLFVVSDKVLFGQHRAKRATEARIIGLINVPGMDWSEKEPIIEKEIADVMKVDNGLFIKDVG